MKKIFGTLCMALTAVAMMAQQPVITFEKTEHDFGKINEADGRVSVVFEFKNEGMAPLVLSNVRASCGCTTPTWTKEPVEPGKKGSITVTYNPNGRPGKFTKTVTITSNATEATTKVYIKGEVIPKPAKPVNEYPVAVGELSMKGKVLDLGTILKGQDKKGELEYANKTQAEHTVALEVHDPYLISQVTLATIKPNESGKFYFAFESNDSKLYGPVEAYAYVVVDGKRDMSEAYQLTIKANIEEDFSQMSSEDKLQAPILETQNEWNVSAAIPAGKSQKYNLYVKNSGVNQLEFRRVYCTGNNITVKSAKPVKSGKRSVITIDINAAGLQPGSYDRELIIISNDYQNPVKKVKVSFTVE